MGRDSIFIIIFGPFSHYSSIDQAETLQIKQHLKIHDGQTAVQDSCRGAKSRARSSGICLPHSALHAYMQEHNAFHNDDFGNFGVIPKFNQHSAFSLNWHRFEHDLECLKVLVYVGILSDAVMF